MQIRVGLYILDFALLLVIMLCALSVITAQHSGRKVQNEIQKQKELTQKLETEWGQLQLEQGTWAAPKRIEELALKQLMLQSVTKDQSHFVRTE